MSLDFPTLPTLNEIYTFGGRSWQWNGTAWDVYSTIPTGNTGATGATGSQGVTGATGPVGDYVISINGKTGAVQGVSAAVAGSGISVSGATGSVTFTNTGVLSFNGNTGAVQGVSSINGNTGAISNVAFTNVNNNFSVTQNFAQGLTAANTVEFYADTSYFYPATKGNRFLTVSPGPQNFITGNGDSSIIINHSSGNVVYIGDAVYIGDVDVANNGTYITVEDNTQNISFNYNATSYTFPTTVGSPGQVLTTNGVNSLSWGNNVSSINGATGGITNVAFTNVAQTFSALQSFSSGISASDGTFAGNITVNSAILGRTGSNYFFRNTGVGSLTTGSKNILIGISAGSALTTNVSSIAIGDAALHNSAKDRCVAIGTNAAIGNTRDEVVAIGDNSAANNTGLYCVAIGTEALLNNTANTVLAIGFNALRNNSGSSSIAIGPSALKSNTNSNNIAIGNDSMWQNTGTRNTAIGNDTLIGGAAYPGQSGNRNSVIGFQSGYNNSTGSDNIYIGHQAGFPKTTGSFNVYIGSGTTGATAASNEIVIGGNAVGLGANTAVIGATAQASATIYGLLNTPGGISASGATFSGNIVLQNNEFIRNSTNGRIDLMPSPSGSTHYGIYFDNTSWGFGTILGTIRSSDGAINTGGNFRFDVPLTILNDTRFQFGNDGHYGVYRSTTGNDTGQLYALSNNASNSGAIALVNYFAVGNSNRSPGTTHVHPNFYIYANGTTSANDFMRLEHDSTRGIIETGGTSGLTLKPGSGVVAIQNKAILGSAALNSATPGCIEFDGNVVYAGTTGGRGVIDASHIAFATSVVSLSGITSYQSIFTSAADVITLAANTSYIVEGHLVIESGTTTHTTAIQLTQGVVVNNPTFRLHFLTTGAAAATPTRAQDTTYFETSGGVLNATSAAARTFILLRGSIETIDSVTITPQVAFSANPGGTNQTAIGSWIKFTPIGTNTMTSVGPWA